MAHSARNWSWLMKKAVSAVLKKYKQEVFITKTARELLFEGYQDDLIYITYHMSHLLPFKLKVPVDRFGWMYDVSLETIYIIFHNCLTF